MDLREEFIALWGRITLYTVIGCALAYLAAALLAWRVHGGGARRAWLPLVGAVIGAAVGFVAGSVPAALITAMYVSIPYIIGSDTAAAMGLAQASLVVYFHLGRGDFIYDES